MNNSWPLASVCSRPAALLTPMALGAAASSGDLLRQDTLPEGVDALPTHAVVVGVGTAEAPASESDQNRVGRLDLLS